MNMLQRVTTKETAEELNKVDRKAPAGSANSLGAESIRDGRPSTDDSVVEAIDEVGPGIVQVAENISPDSWANKGAVESNPRPKDKRDSENVSLAGQLGHRDQDEILKDNDTDFPEPDAQPEHSGEPPNNA